MSAIRVALVIIAALPVLAWEPPPQGESWFRQVTAALSLQDQGRTEQARSQMATAIAAAIEAGRHDLEVGAIWDRLASIDLELGDLENARIDLHQARILLEPRAAEAATEMGHHWMHSSILALNQRRFSQAVEYAERALRFRQMAKNQRPSDLAECHHQIGISLQGARLKSQAQRSYEDAERLCRQPGACYPALVGSIAAAIVMSKVQPGNLDQSIEGLTNAVNYLEAAGAPPPIVLRPMNNLGVLELRSKRAKNAEKTLGRALDMAERMIGKRNPLSAEIKRNYSFVLELLHRKKEARRLREEAEEALREWAHRNELQHAVALSDLLSADGT